MSLLNSKCLHCTIYASNTNYAFIQHIYPNPSINALTKTHTVLQTQLATLVSTLNAHKYTYKDAQGRTRTYTLIRILTHTDTQTHTYRPSYVCRYTYTYG